ncbi:MAG TPA: hypothetical protein VI818_07140 [Candidatus Thermoplasmatota archaeon]|nr:hypothetical protein [Candidatus Thermoplasmatota archaeon]
MAEETKPMVAPITVERHYQVSGKRLTVHITFPAQIAKEIGLETMYLCAQRVLVSLDSKEHRIKELKLGE